MLPDFLCIGAQKAGTTWLHAMLGHHPEIWLPRVKELHYFGEAELHRSPLLPGYYDARWRRQFKKRFGRHGWSGLAWDLRYFFAPRSHAWYASLFEPGRGRVTGDITPRYSKLESADVARIHALLPEAKIVYLLRDQIERAWSSARMAAERRGLDLEDPERLASHLTAQKEGRGDYLRTLRTWREHYPREQILVGFYDDIVEDPEGFLRRLCDFLGVDGGTSWIPASVHERRNASREVPMPASVASQLAGMYGDDLRELHELVGGPVERWLKRAESLVAVSQSASAAAAISPSSRVRSAGASSLAVKLDGSSPSSRSSSTPERA